MAGPEAIQHVAARETAGVEVSSVLLVVPWLSDNSVGRAYCLGLVCEHLGLDYRVVSMSGPSPLWEPLRGTAFASHCYPLGMRRRGDRDCVRRWMSESHAVVAVKPLPESLGRCLRLASPRTRLIVDVDDPDIEAGTTWKPALPRVRAMVGPRYWHLLGMRRKVGVLPVTVGNPVLQEIYGGTLIPHVRAPDDVTAPPHVSRRPLVSFVGTPRPYKGLDVLRRAVSALAAEGFRLGISAARPDDALPHETWYGVTSLAAGLQIVRDTDIVAVPSLDAPTTRAQFPVKIVDALMAGRALVASNVGPIPWAVGRGGHLVPPGDVDALIDALRRLADPDTRRRLGDWGRQWGVQNFTPESVSDTFLRVVSDAPELSDWR